MTERNNENVPVSDQVQFSGKLREPAPDYFDAVVTASMGLYAAGRLGVSAALNAARLVPSPREMLGRVPDASLSFGRTIVDLTPMPEDVRRLMHHRLSYVEGRREGVVTDFRPRRQK